MEDCQYDEHDQGALHQSKEGSKDAVHLSNDCVGYVMVDHVASKEQGEEGNQESYANTDNRSGKIAKAESCYGIGKELVDEVGVGNGGNPGQESENTTQESVPEANEQQDGHQHETDYIDSVHIQAKNKIFYRAVWMRTVTAVLMTTPIDSPSRNIFLRLSL